MWVYKKTFFVTVINSYYLIVYKCFYLSVKKTFFVTVVIGRTSYYINFSIKRIKNTIYYYRKKEMLSDLSKTIT